MPRFSLLMLTHNKRRHSPIETNAFFPSATAVGFRLRDFASISDITAPHLREAILARAHSDSRESPQPSDVNWFCCAHPKPRGNQRAGK